MGVGSDEAHGYGMWPHVLQFYPMQGSTIMPRLSILVKIGQNWPLTLLGTTLNTGWPFEAMPEFEGLASSAPASGPPRMWQAL